MLHLSGREELLSIGEADKNTRSLRSSRKERNVPLRRREKKDREDGSSWISIFDMQTGYTQLGENYLEEN